MLCAAEATASTSYGYALCRRIGLTIKLERRSCWGERAQVIPYYVFFLHSAWKNVLAVAAFSGPIRWPYPVTAICVLWTVDRLYTATALEGFA